MRDIFLQLSTRRQVADNHVLSGTLAGTTATHEPYLCNPNNLPLKHCSCESQMSSLKTWRCDSGDFGWRCKRQYLRLMLTLKKGEGERAKMWKRVLIAEDIVSGLWQAVAVQHPLLILR
ncbi:Flavohemoprotein [Fusarium oxysporum f. sp. albedinis]|nr:Flavohemoprotein [Fusarium oxysporum f. sp. albedinis]